jgi:hypothetical protein
MKIAEGLLEERAEQLAVVHLTRRDDLVVVPAHADYGIDLLVHIAKAGTRTGRIFGVQIAARNAVKFVHNGASEGQKVSISLPFSPAFSDLPFPLCLFVFSMENDEGYYRWILEPMIEADARPRLVLNEQNFFRKLTKIALDNIVQSVNTWYEARNR